MSSESANGRVAAGLIAAGLPLDAQPGPNRKALGMMLLETAANRGQPELFATLAAKGWLARMPRTALNTLFATSGGGCDPAIARAMIAAGADPNARSGPSNEDFGPPPGGSTALMAALQSYQCPDAGKPALVAALLALGVDINAVSTKGESAIFGVEDSDLLDFLLANGARADIKSKDGYSAIFSSWTDVIVLRLLEAGADPRGFYEMSNGASSKKISLRQMAQEQDMPAVLAWLESHGIK
jgi:hypothetical protein